MTFGKIASYTALHFALAVVFWFLAFGATGLGFKDDWSVWDYIYTSLSFGGAATLTFPLWLLTLLKLPEWVTYLFIPMQIVISFLQVKLFIYLHQLWRVRNKKSVADANNALHN
jgi:hypothetical protein